MRLSKTWFSVAGAALILSLPISSAVAQSSTGSGTIAPENPPPAGASAGSGTILPEDDDDDNSGSASNSKEAEKLFKQATEQFHNRQYPAALQTYQQVLTIRKQIGDRLGVGDTLQQIGAVYDRLGEYAQALTYYQQALTIRQQIDNKVGIGSTLNSIGSVYQQQGNFRRALQFYEQALAIRKQVKDTAGVGRTLNNLGLAYNQLGQYPRAIEFYQQALNIFQSLNNPTGVGATLNNIGLVKTQLGQYEQAIKSYEQALTVRQKINDKAGIGTTLHNIGFVYDKQNNPNQALEFYQKALVIRTEVGDKAGIGATLNNIGVVYAILQQQSKALTSLNRALAMFQEIGDQAGEGRTTDSIGTAYKILHNWEQALGYYQQALAIQREVGDLDGERITLSNIGEVLAQQKQHSLAIVFYKQSINVTEAIQKDLRVLETSQQESYTTTISDTYRALASLLLDQNRVVEGQQILDLLKVQELDDYLRNVPSNQQTAVGIQLLPGERQILAKYSTIQKQLVVIDRELITIRQVPPPERSVTQKQRLTQLEQQQQQIQAEFNQFTNSPEVVALVQQLNQSLRTQNPELPNFNYLQQQLKTLDAKAALLYPLILEDRLELVLITANAPPVHRSIAVTRTELKQAVADFRSALTNRKLPTKRVLQPANKLYNWLIAPIEKDLAAAGVNSIIYAPDGQLRVRPFSGIT
jgi:tetratricopeptide (TPR) repeat protein